MNKTIFYCLYKITEGKALDFHIDVVTRGFAVLRISFSWQASFFTSTKGENKFLLSKTAEMGMGTEVRVGNFKGEAPPKRGWPYQHKQRPHSFHASRALCWLKRSRWQKLLI